ncbi:methyltransferase domain-containing protein [Streptomyces sp. M10(2022)]
MCSCPGGGPGTPAATARRRGSCATARAIPRRGCGTSTPTPPRHPPRRPPRRPRRDGPHSPGGEWRSTSSSTLPALVLMMYRAAWITDTSRLLVTCGSGYGTALACARLGGEQVTSVDVDPYLVQAARKRLAEAGHHPRVEVCDLTGALPEGSYDRIISTVSVPAVPVSWLEALAPAGGW